MQCFGMGALRTQQNKVGMKSIDFPFITIFREFQEARQNDDETSWLPNSHDIVVDAMIDLRNECLDSREIIENRLLQNPWSKLLIYR